MIKVYKPLFGGENVRRSKISGNEAEVWAELTCAMHAIFHTASRTKGREKAERLLMTAAAKAMVDEQNDGKDETDE